MCLVVRLFVGEVIQVFVCDMVVVACCIASLRLILQQAGWNTELGTGGGTIKNLLPISASAFICSGVESRE